MPNARVGFSDGPIDIAATIGAQTSVTDTVSDPFPHSYISRQPSILLLDDDPTMLRLQSGMLSSMGFRKVTSALSAKDALLQLDNDPRSADVIICDLRMPDMDGIEFLQLVNASPFRGSVILLSGESTRIMHTVQKLLNRDNMTVLGALTKPATRKALRALIECWRPAEAIPEAATLLQVTADELHEANRRREWVLYYQPQVDLHTGRCVGMEALIRWEHPRHGLVYPDSFIDLAEHCGAIQGLTDLVAETVLSQHKAWHEAGWHVRMAINISLMALETGEFWRTFGKAVTDASVDPKDITLEITETRLASFSRIALENLVRLRMQHFALSIDDFGVGHSSLAQLRDVPFTELKIDRGFVTGARSNQIIRPILEGGLAIARRMDMTSVAEGVETEEDWELVRELDCDLAQGYFIARPMTAHGVWDWLQLWEERRKQLLSPP